LTISAVHTVHTVGGWIFLRMRIHQITHYQEPISLINSQLINVVTHYIIMCQPLYFVWHWSGWGDLHAQFNMCACRVSPNLPQLKLSHRSLSLLQQELCNWKWSQNCSQRSSNSHTAC